MDSAPQIRGVNNASQVRAQALGPDTASTASAWIPWNGFGQARGLTEEARIVGVFDQVSPPRMQVQIRKVGDTRTKSWTLRLDDASVPEALRAQGRKLLAQQAKQTATPARLPIDRMTTSKVASGAIEAAPESAANTPWYTQVLNPVTDPTTLVGPKSWIGKALFAVNKVLNPVEIAREALYVKRAVGAVTTEEFHPAPTKEEAWAALAFKGIPRAFSLPVFVASTSLGPIGIGATIALGLSLDAFYGLFARTWNKFQQRMTQERGAVYQTAFNFVHGQSWAMTFRGIAHADNAAIAGPFSGAFWREAIVMAGLGATFGSCGIRGYNSLYKKGWLSERGRTYVTLGRDALFATTGLFFGAGGGLPMWICFGLQQAVDVGLWAGGKYLPDRKGIHAAADKTSATTSPAPQPSKDAAPEELASVTALKPASPQATRAFVYVPASGHIRPPRKPS